MKLTTRQITARQEALEEAASHLELSWTNDLDEIEQGKWVSKKLRDMILKLNNILSAKLLDAKQEKT